MQIKFPDYSCRSVFTQEAVVYSSSVKKAEQKQFSKKVVLKNIAKFTGKHQCQGLFFNKVAGLSPATLLK